MVETQSIFSKEQLSSITQQANTPVFATEADRLAFAHQAHLNNGVQFVFVDEAFDKNKSYVQTYGINDQGNITLDGKEAQDDEIYASIEDIIGEDEIMKGLKKVAGDKKVKEFLSGLQQEHKRDIQSLRPINKIFEQHYSEEITKKEFLYKVEDQEQKNFLMDIFNQHSHTELIKFKKYFLRFNKANKGPYAYLSNLPDYLQELYQGEEDKVLIIPLIKSYIRQQKQKRYYRKTKQYFWQKPFGIKKKYQPYQSSLSKDSTILPTTPICYTDLYDEDKQRFKTFLATRGQTFRDDKPNPPKHLVRIPRNITAIQMLGVLLDIQAKYPEDPDIAKSMDDLRSSSSMGSLNHTIANAQKDMLAVLKLEEKQNRKEPNGRKSDRTTQERIDRAKELRGSGFMEILEKGLTETQIKQLFMKNTAKLTTGFRRELFASLQKKESDEPQSLIEQLKSGLVNQVQSIDMLSEAYLDSIHRARLELRDYMLTGKSNGQGIRPILAKVFGDEVGDIIATEAIKLKDQLQIKEKAKHLRKLRDMVSALKTKIHVLELEKEKTGKLTKNKQKFLEVSKYALQIRIEQLAQTEKNYTNSIMKQIHQAYYYSKTHDNSYTSSGNHLIATQEMICTGFALLTQSCLQGIGIEKVYGMRMSGHATIAIADSAGKHHIIDTTWGDMGEITGDIQRNNSHTAGTIEPRDTTIYQDETNLSLTTNPDHEILSSILYNIARYIPPGQENLEIALYTQAINYNEYNEVAYNNRGVISEKLYLQDKTNNIFHLYQATHDRFVSGVLDLNNGQEQLKRAKTYGRNELSEEQKKQQLENNSELHTLIKETAPKIGRNAKKLRKKFKTEVAGVKVDDEE